MLVCVAMLVGARRAAGLQARAALAGAMRRGPMRGARALAAEPAGGGRVSAAVVQKKSEEKQEKLELTPPRGTRDFYPEELRVRDWLFGKWRAVAALHGFEEYDAPVLESPPASTVSWGKYSLLDQRPRRGNMGPMVPSGPTSELWGDRLVMKALRGTYTAKERPGLRGKHKQTHRSEALYIRKAGEEVTQQLYNFEDKGGRRVTLRPEMTPSLARMVMARRGGLALPLKWFAVPQCWRYERATRGRRREHYQWNMDVWGVPGVAAEAELLGAMVSFFESVGLTSKDVGIKVNSRRVLAALLERFVGVAADDTRFASACVLVDKLEKALLGVAADQVDSLHAALFAPGAADAQAHGHATGSLAALKAAVCDSGDAASSAVGAFDDLAALDKLANAHGYADWLVYDASVVRGLAYYTGAVFEAFDRSGTLRAIAGGGRYDKLLETFGGEATPAVGFGLGDAVIMELLNDKGLVPCHLALPTIDVVVFCIEDSLLDAAVAVAKRLRAGGLKVDLVLEARKPKWAFKHADRRNAPFAVMLADEWGADGSVVVKALRSSDQATVQLNAAGAWIAERQAPPVA